MKEQRQSKLLRITLFLGVAAGLAFGSSLAMAQDDEPFELEGEEPMEVEDTEGIDEEPEVAEEVEVDYPGDIEDLAEFISDHQEEGIENVAEYTEDGAKLMVDAMEEVIPGESGWFRDRPEEYQAFEDDLEAWEDRVDELSDHEREDFAQLATDVLTEGAEWINALQASAYPALSDEANAVTEAANRLDGERSIDEQGDAVQGYFEASLTAIEGMYRAHEEDPVTQRQGATVAYALHGETVAGEYEEGIGEVAEEPELSPEVQAYSDFVNELDREILEGEEGERMTVDGLREMEGALSLFIEEEEAIEGVAMEGEEEMGMEEEEGIDGETETLSDHRDNLNTYIEELEASIGTEEFGENLKTSVDTAADLLTAIQEDQFPEFADAANAVTEAADNIESAPVNEQSEELLGFFENSREALESMCNQRTMEEDPAV